MCFDLILPEPRAVCFLILKKEVKCRKNYLVGGRKEHTCSPAAPQAPLFCTPLLRPCSSIREIKAPILALEQQDWRK
jgi:hypothetical protein